MADISPFPGIRYAKKNVSRLVCPPYDVISPAARRRLAHLSKDNFVGVELPSAPAGRDRYAAARAKFRGLLARRAMIRDEESLYVYTQRFRVARKKFERSGLIAAVRLEDPARGRIYPHEKILPNARRDRERLLLKLGANTSPVFFLTDTPSFAPLLARLKKSSVPVSVAVADGVVHELRKIPASLPGACAAVRALRHKNLYIADGHHRYDVAWRFSRSMPSAPRRVLGFIAAADDKNIVIMPTHRVAAPPPGLGRRLELFKEITAREFAAQSERLPQPLKIRLAGKTRHLRLKNIKSAGSPELRGIAPSVAAALIGPLPPETIKYTSSEKAAASIADKEKKLAVILPPVPASAVAAVARNREHMPQKSTFFYPKVYAGFVVYYPENSSARPSLRPSRQTPPAAPRRPEPRR